LVFINSLGTDFRIWDGLIPYFAERFAILRYDKRGHGLSDCPPAPYSIRDHKDDLAALLSELGIGPAILVGISIGGMIAMDFAATYPERVRALVLCDTGATIGNAAFWSERISIVRTQGMAAVAEGVVARWLTVAFATQQPAAYRGHYHMLARAPVAGYTATCEALRDADLSQAARTISAKTLILCGAQDMTTPPESSRVLGDMIKGSRFELIENAAHLPCIEQSEALAATMKRFFREGDYG
jgi:3-oxoadipate enol-lactonase